MKKVRDFVLVLGIVFLFASSAGAAIVIDDWTFNLTGVDGLGTTVIDDVGQIVFNGVAHATNPTFPNAGLGFVDGLLNAESFKDTNGITIGTSGVNSAYQMNFDFSVDTAFSALSGNSIDFTHPAPTLTDGILEIWIDNTANAFTPASNTTGLGFQDGEMIASFKIVPGGGGTYFTGTQDGSDDATFSLIFAKPGVIFDSFGNDLSLLGDYLLAVTDSNFDTDPLSTGLPFAIGGTTWTDLPSSWPFASKGFGSPGSFFAEEDGSARLAVVPEPSTFLLLGCGILGLAYVGRKRAKR